MPTIRLDLQQLEKELGEESQQIMLDLANEIINEIKQNVNVASGDLRRSYQIFRTGKGEVWLGSRLPYALPLDTGTGPVTPPFENIQVWARRKLGDQSAAGPVFHKLRTEGMDAHPYLEKSVDNAINRVTR